MNRDSISRVCSVSPLPLVASIIVTSDENDIDLMARTTGAAASAGQCRRRFAVDRLREHLAMSRLPMRSGVKQQGMRKAPALERGL